MTPNEQRGYDVFISHSSLDWEYAGELKKQLESLGISVWLDHFGIKGGENIVESIKRGLETSRTTLLLVTRSSPKSSWVHLEIAKGYFNQDGNLIPILLEKIEDNLQLLEILGHIKQIDLTESNAQKRSRNYQEFLETLLDRAGHSKPAAFPAPLPFRRHRSFDLVSGGSVLAIGAHWDDVLLGCFGFLLKLKLLFHYRVEILVLCNHYGRYFGVEQDNLKARSEEIYKQINGCFGIPCTFIDGGSNFPDREFHIHRNLLDSFLREYAQNQRKENKEANLILVPPSDDHHEDHAITSTLAMSHFRGPHQTVLEYEIKPHSDRVFVPNLFVGLSEKINCAQLKGMLYEDKERTLAELKMKMLTKLVLETKETCVKEAEFLFGEETLMARLRINALDYGGDKTVWYGEAFRGSVHL
jgi:hypothetical protein